MKNQQFLSTLIIFPLACSQLPGIGNQSSKPNIVLFIADDMGWGDISCHGHPRFRTPNIDSLARNGIDFYQFYVNCPVCSPTRVGILTGGFPARYSINSGLEDQGRFFNPNIHYEDDRKLPPVPEETGFYGTIEIADRAIDHLRNHKKKCPDEPFFSYVAFTAPHFPLHALPEDIEKVGKRYAPGWKEFRVKRWERIKALGIVPDGVLSEVEYYVGPPYYFPEAYKNLGSGEVNLPLQWDSLTPGQKKFQQDKMTIHAAMIERMDIEIGRIIAQLKDMGEFENTLIVFLSDNGASAEIMVRADGHDPQAPPGSASSYLCLGPGWSNMCNTPFMRHKTWVHEGGTCTPFIVHWPDGIRARGELRHTHGHVVDIVPTILELTNVSSDPVYPMPGKSLKSKFKNDSKWEHPLWWYHEGNRAYREGEWKIVAASDEDWELFNIDRDRTESNNLAESNPEKVDELERRWYRLLEDFQKVSASNKLKNQAITHKTEN